MPKMPLLIEILFAVERIRFVPSTKSPVNEYKTKLLLLVNRIPASPQVHRNETGDVVPLHHEMHPQSQPIHRITENIHSNNNMLLYNVHAIQK